MGHPYREAYIPDVDDRIIIAISNGRKKYEERKAEDDAALKKWAEEGVFGKIVYAEGYDTHSATITLNDLPRPHLSDVSRLHKAYEYLKQVNGWTVEFVDRNHDHGSLVAAYIRISWGA